jgi:hypothetical protein
MKSVWCSCKVILLLLVGARTSWSQSSDELRMQAFAQGGAKNCASIALIKAAIQRYGFQVFDTLRVSGGVRVTLRDKTALTVSDKERRQAARAAAFAISNNALPLVEKVAILQYATLCYAVLAQYVATQRLYGCTKQDNSAWQSPAKKSFSAALKFISKTGFCSDNCYRHLGLQVKDTTAPPYDPRQDYSAEKGVVAYNNGHAVFVLGTRFDHYGTWEPLKQELQSKDAAFEPKWVFELQ